MCTRAQHEDMKRDRATFRASTTYAGHQPDDEEPLEYGNCRCGSTLAIAADPSDAAVVSFWALFIWLRAVALGLYVVRRQPRLEVVR